MQATSNDAWRDASAINLDHIQTVEQARLTRFVGTVGADIMRSVCRALAVATGCGD